MKSKKVHLSILKDDLWVKCCDTRKYAFYEFTKDITKVTCKSCVKTKYYQEQVQKMESERKASREELGIKDDEFEVLDYELRNNIVCITKCPYEMNLDDKFGNCYIGCIVNCQECEYFISSDSSKQQVKCSFKANNKPKTQLELDKEKYNLSDEHVEILSKVDYEVVEVGLSNECKGCLLQGGVCPSDGEGRITCTQNGKEYIFKQVHKTQESLNESIEKEEVEKGIEEPHVWVNNNDGLRKVKPSDSFLSTNKIEEPHVWIDAPQLPTDIPIDAPTIRIPIEETKQESKHYQNEKGIPGFKKTLDDMYSTMLAKNSDYTGEKGAFDNFLMVSKLGITTPEKGILVRMTDKICRISNLLENDAKVKDEAITDTLLDLANYSVILKCLIESKRIKKEMK